MAKRKKSDNDQPQNDFGTYELSKRQHVTIEQPDPYDAATKRVRVESDMIDWYLRRHYINQVQADALRKWQSDAYLAGLMPSCTGNYEGSIDGGGSDISDTRLAAQARRFNAQRYLSNINAQFVELVEAVAVRGYSAGRYMLHKCGMPPDEALIFLDRASTALAKHFGFVR